MAGTIKELEFQEFTGVNNMEDPTRLVASSAKGTPLRVGLNVDIDNTKMIHRRKGRTKLVATSTHSLWANDVGTLCFCVQGGWLKRLMPDNSLIALLAVNANAPMAYAEFGDGTVYFSNNEIVGYISTDGTIHAFPDPTQAFKQRMVGGTILEVFHNRLYAVQDNLIIFSDATAPMRLDTRKFHIAMDGKITMLLGVKDGLYCSHGERVTFLAGNDPVAQPFTYVPISEVPAILGMSCKADLGKDKKGDALTVAMWMTEFGLDYGFPGGKGDTMTDGFQIPGAARGCAFWSHLNDYSQFVAAYQFKQGEGGLDFDVDIPVPIGGFFAHERYNQLLGNVPHSTGTFTASES